MELRTNCRKERAIFTAWWRNRGKRGAAALNNMMKGICYVLAEVAKNAKKMLCYKIIMNVFTVMETLINLFLLKLVVDYVLSANFNYAELLLYLLAYLLGMSLWSVFGIRIVWRTINKCQYDFVTNCASKLYKKSLEIEMIHFNKNEFYDKLDRAINHAGMHHIDLLDQCFSFLSNGICFFSVMAIYRNPVLLIATAIDVSAYLIYYFGVNKRNYQFGKNEERFNRFENYLNRVFSDRIYAQELRTSSGTKEILTDKYDRWWKTHHEHYKVYTRNFTGITMLLAYTPRELILAFSSIYVTNLFFRGSCTVGDFLVLVVFVSTMSERLINVFKVLPELYQTSLYISEYEELMNYPARVDYDEEKVEIREFESLRFNNVSFKYEVEDQFHIHDLSFEVRSNEVIAIAGLNGSGKSTIVDLIMGLLKPDSGCLELNGMNYENYKVEHIKNLFGIVFQDFQTYELSIAENILMREADTQEDCDLVKEALQYAGLYEKVSSFEGGIHTTVSARDDDGYFSGGEMQMLAIARAYASQRPVLIFDEPTSALDVYMTNLFFTKLFQLREERNKTIIMVSHKLKYVSKADRIFFVEGGTVSELGNHSELLKLNDKYAKLYQTSHEDLFAGE